MSHKNYAKYSQVKRDKNNEVVLDKTSIDTPEVNEEWVVTQEDDGVHVRPSIDGEIIDTPVEEIITQNDEEFKQPDPIPAIVVNCAKLRVRKAPDANADIYGTIEEGTELTIADEEDVSYGDFYKVYTYINDTLIEGYCMKKFIKIK